MPTHLLLIGPEGEEREFGGLFPSQASAMEAVTAAEDRGEFVVLHQLGESSLVYSTK